MEKNLIGPIIRQIADEKHIKVMDLARRSNKSRQAVYAAFSKIKMDDEELNEWAKLLDVPKEEIIRRWNGDRPTHLDVLAEQIAKIEQLFKEQLEIKDLQIERMQKTIDILLGKSKGVANEPMCRIIPLLGNGNTFGHTQPAA